MFIKNFDKIEQKIITNKIIGEYLIKNGIPLLSKDDNTYIFSDTEKVQHIMNNLPFYLRIFNKEKEGKRIGK